MNQNNNLIRSELKNTVRRLVIKVGTSSLTHNTGLINIEKIEKLVRQITNISHMDIEVILVSSGAIGAGMGILKVDKSTATLPEKQALAAVGQNVLLHMYQKLFSEYGIQVGQILLTRDGIENTTRKHHSTDALEALLKYKVIPIINENDAVAVEEIKFGDNDRLSAMVAEMIKADLLIILSDIDGLYDAHPKLNSDAKLIPYVRALNQSIYDTTSGPSTDLGTGGMTTKLQAVEIAGQSGCKVIIANSETENILNKLINGDNLGTLFDL